MIDLSQLFRTVLITAHMLDETDHLSKTAGFQHACKFLACLCAWPLKQNTTIRAEEHNLQDPVQRDYNNQAAMRQTFNQNNVLDAAGTRLHVICF